MSFQYANLSNSVLLASIIGILFCVIYLPKISLTWAFTLGIFFLILFISIMITLSKSK